MDRGYQQEQEWTGAGQTQALRAFGEPVGIWKPIGRQSLVGGNFVYSKPTNVYLKVQWMLGIQEALPAFTRKHLVLFHRDPFCSRFVLLNSHESGPEEQHDHSPDD